MKKILFICPHLSTGGLPQVAFKKIQNLILKYDLLFVEYSNISNEFVVQKNKIKSILPINRFITLDSDKFKLLSIIYEFNPDYIHFEEIPELFVNMQLCNIIYDNNRKYFITESTHTSKFDISNKKFFPDKFMHVSRFTFELYKSLNIKGEVIEYPIEYKSRPDRTISLELLKLDPEYYHVLNVGLFTPGKNQGEIFQIANNMKSDKILFHFVGNLAMNFEGYWKPLMLNKSDNCIIHGERSDVDRFYSCMDLFLFTSKYELNPIVIKEAISYNMKLLMYNLDVYMGMFNNIDNISFLSDDIYQNIIKIKKLLMSHE